MRDPSDSEDICKVEEFLAGDVRAFEFLFDKYREKVYRIAYKTVQNYVKNLNGSSKTIGIADDVRNATLDLAKKILKALNCILKIGAKGNLSSSVMADHCVQMRGKIKCSS